jgi:CRISPR-associated endonuclease Csn1
MRYRLALDLGSTSLGWAMVRLNTDNPPAPVAVIKAGVRIFSDGRNPKDGSSLAVTRREARAMRRRRDRLLKRKARMTKALIEHGFFPADQALRKALVMLNPYALRTKGLDEALKPEEFARALFHINQRRGFKSNRKTDKKDNDSGVLKQAIGKLRSGMTAANCRTVGEWLHQRDAAGDTVRARYREVKVLRDDGKPKINKSYDLYIDRAMIEAEFDTLWAKQASIDPTQFNAHARDELKDALLHQRPLKPVKPGRCTLMPDEERAPLALPSTQRFRMYQEVNNLRILREGLKEEPLTLQQRDILVGALERHSKRTFTQIKTLLNVGGAAQFNFEDPKRQELKGNTTSAILGDKKHFGEAWFAFDEAKQDAIVLQLVQEENLAKLVRWLQEQTGIDEPRTETIANAGLPEGYGSLCATALARILPELRRDVVTYDKAVLAAGFEHHSNISPSTTGEILAELPYYGNPLQRHVGFGTGRLEDSEEKRYGKIANPTVHIGLNQVRTVVNALITRYGHPSEVIVELARDLKQSKDHSQNSGEPYREKPGCSCRRCVTAQQANNQHRNKRLRADVAGVLKTPPERVRAADIQKMILWEELSNDPADRRCPYSGVQISTGMLLSEQVEIEHILPFSETLDDSLNNKTVAMRQANRIKGNRTPWQARDDFAAQGWSYADIIERAKQIPNKAKRDRFAEDGLERWRKDSDFLARALNDTRYLSKVACEYLRLICPQNTRVIPGRMTAMLRGKFGLNDVLGLDGEKNRNDHRHHAVDACVIAVTDQGLLQRFARASASAREQQLNRLVDNMPMPWGTDQDRQYFNSVKRAIYRIWVSHKPDHGHEGAMHEDTAYRPPHLDAKGMWRTRGIGGNKPNEKNADSEAILPMKAGYVDRHARNEKGEPLPYKGYVGGSNYCIEIVRNEKGKWEGEVISTAAVYQMMREQGAERAHALLRSNKESTSGKPLVMRILKGDVLRLELDGHLRLLQVTSVKKQMELFDHLDAGKDSKPITKYAGSLQAAKTRRVTISPIGELRDPGFKE